ncbi:MAG: tetratricopeptide repeat protein [Gammaproteobacteria bacterium]|nr:tetratricopeptide repeat protein [Gammaproteobacteria bacterium]
MKQAKTIFLCISLLLLTGCDTAVEYLFCRPGVELVRAEKAQEGIESLTSCLKVSFVESKQRAYYLRARAWGHYSLGNFQLAVTDQKTANDLHTPVEHGDFINYALYLRKAGKVEESLKPLFNAERLDEASGHPSMMTQYHLGWSLYELERYDEAIAAFSKGIPAQSDYPFVFFRRGLAYDKIGAIELARADFEKFVSLRENQNMPYPESFLSELQKVIQKYEVLQNES